LVPATCRRWKCPRCGRRKARILAARIARTKAKRFITLTYRPRPDKSPQEALDELNHAWRTIWKRVKRAQGARAAGYVRIVEVTRAGWPHLHLAVDCQFISQENLSTWTEELLDSPIVDIRAIKTEKGLARYLAKYLTKQSEAISSRRRYGATPQFLPPAPAPVLEPGELPPHWRFSSIEPEALAVRLILGGAYAEGEWWILPDEYSDPST
jgi:hypothetical protein